MNRGTIEAALINALTLGLIAYAIQLFILRSDPTYSLWFAVVIGAAGGIGYYIGRTKKKQ